MGLWETNLFKFLNIFFCEKPLFSPPYYYDYCYWSYYYYSLLLSALLCVYTQACMCATMCFGRQKTTLSTCFFPFTVHSGDWTQVVRLVQKVLLLTEPSHWPLIYFSKQYLQGTDFSAAGLPHPTPRLLGCCCLVLRVTPRGARVWFLASLLCKYGSLLPGCWHGVFFISSFLQFKILRRHIAVLCYIFVCSPFTLCVPWSFWAYLPCAACH